MGLGVFNQRVIGIVFWGVVFVCAGCGDDASDGGGSPDGAITDDGGNADGGGEDSGSPGDDCEVVVADEDCDRTLRPIVFVHGTFGSATEISNTAMLFGSNGYCQERFVAIEYDSVLERDPAARLADFIDQVIEDTGFEQIELAGHSQGTGHACTYLSDPENAAKVAHYLNISGVCDGRGVPTLSLSSKNDGVSSLGSGAIHSSGENVTQVTLEDEDHVALAGSKHAFAAMWKFLYDEEPRYTTIQCGQDPITIDGKSTTFGDNVPRPGSVIEVYEIDELDDPYERGEPRQVIVADEDGHFSAKLARNVAYEFRALNADGTLAGHVYYGPFQRSNYLMRFLAEANSPLIRASSSDMLVRSSAHVGLVARYIAGSFRKDWGNSLKIDGEEILTADNAGMTDRVVGMFMYDANENGESDLGAVFGPSSFLVGTDVFMDASEPRFMELEWTNEEGRTTTFKIPNWPSDQSLVNIVLPH